MNTFADADMYRSTNTALMRISIALQLLERYTQLSEQQRQFVNAALQGVADLKKIVGDEAHRCFSQQPPVPSKN
jgi:hypothetical protein